MECVKFYLGKKHGYNVSLSLTLGYIRAYKNFFFNFNFQRIVLVTPFNISLHSSYNTQENKVSVKAFNIWT
jgi:hypothetical protein